MIRKLLFNRENWEDIAVIDGTKNILYRDLAKRALAIQSHLPREQGLNIAIFLPNNSDFIMAFFGTLMFGMRALTLNILMTKYEIISLLKEISIFYVITSKEFDSIFEEIVADEIPELQIVYVEDLHSNEYIDLATVVNIKKDEPMVLLNTSGTTGNPKIVKLSEKNVETSVLGYIDKMNFKNTDIKDIRYLLATPFSSPYGLMILSACLMKSFPIVLLKEGFTLDGFYKTIQEHKITHYEGGSMVIKLMEKMADRPIPYDISSLKRFGFGGSKVSANTIKKLLESYPGLEFSQGYGMTEASPLIAKIPLVAEHRKAMAEKLGSVGTAIKGVEIAVETNGEITNEPYINGEIVVKGANVMLGYYNNEAATNEVLKNSYLYTGDIGYLDEDDYLYIYGRKKNIIIVRGLNVHAEEVEECILNTLLVEDCMVYGEIDTFGNESVSADIVPINPNVKIEDIRDYCGIHLSKYKQPYKIQFVKSIKKVISGKIERGISNSQ